MKLSLLDHNKSANEFLKEIVEGKLGHAYIFVSEDKEIRKALFTKLCLSAFKNDAATRSQILSKNYVDIKYYDAEDKLKIDDIEDFIEDTHILPVLSDKKLYFIDCAEKLDIRYQNKILKTFEEPPAYVTTVLGVNNETGLLTTVKSRGKKIYIDGLDYQDIYNELINNGITKDNAALAAAYAQGNFKKAMDFATDEHYKDIYKDTLNTFLHLTNSRQIPEFLYSEIFNKENISVTLNFYELFLMDILKYKSGSQLPTSTLLPDNILSSAAKGYTVTSAYTAINTVNEGRIRLNNNISSVSVAEKILFDILEAKYKWQQ